MAARIPGRLGRDLGKAPFQILPCLGRAFGVAPETVGGLLQIAAPLVLHAGGVIRATVEQTAQQRAAVFEAAVEGSSARVIAGLLEFLCRQLQQTRTTKLDRRRRVVAGKLQVARRLDAGFASQVVLRQLAELPPPLPVAQYAFVDAELLPTRRRGGVIAGGLVVARLAGHGTLLAAGATPQPRRLTERPRPLQVLRCRRGVPMACEQCGGGVMIPLLLQAASARQILLVRHLCVAVALFGGGVVLAVGKVVTLGFPLGGRGNPLPDGLEGDDIRRPIHLIGQGVDAPDRN